MSTQTTAPALPKPFGARLLVKLEAVEEKTSGGIILQKEAQVQRLRGKVVDHGRLDYPDGYNGDRLDDLIGTEVIFMDFGLPEIDGLDGYMIVPEDAVVAYIA